VAAENIDNTVDGAGLFNTKIPGLSDAADIQAALRLYHYGSYTYDGANADPEDLLIPSMARHLQDLVDADAAEVVNRNAAIAVETTNRNTAISNHNAATLNVHGILNTALLATKLYVDESIENSAPEYPELAGEGLVWNAVTSKFDVNPRILNLNTTVTKTSSFTLEEADVNKTIVLNMSSASTLTIPSNSSVAIPVGYQFNLLEMGLGRTTFSLGSGVTLNSKNSQMYIDGQYGKATLLKLAEDSWVAYGDIYEGVSTPAPTPVSPTPTAPTPTAPTPTAPTPTAPTPTAPTPTVPTPTAPTPTAPTPTAPTPTVPTPTAPTPTVPTPTAPTPTPPIVNYYGFCTLSNVAFGPQETSYSCIDAYNAQENANGYPPIGWVCGSTPLSGTPSCGSSPTPTAPTPTAPTPTAPTPTVPTPTAPTPTGTVWYCTSNYTNEVGGQFEWSSNITGSVCGESAVACSTSGYPATPSIPNCSPTPTAPTPTAPTPTAPTPTAPTPTAPTPSVPTPSVPTPSVPTPSVPTPSAPTPSVATVWYCTTNYTNEAGGQYTSSTNDTGSSCGDYAIACSTSGYPGTPSIPNCAPTPTVPTPTAPTPSVPTPSVPTPSVPTPSVPTPSVPTPSVPTPTAPTPSVSSPYFSPYFQPRWGSDYRLKDGIEEYRVGESAEIISDLEIN
jgi:hypothetical protein